jgi:phage tail-like protein
VVTKVQGVQKNAPISGFQFTVHSLANAVGLDPIPINDVGFSEVSGLTDDTEAVEYKEGNDLYTDMLPGQTKPQELTLSRGVDRSGFLVAWRELVKERTYSPGQGFRCDLILSVYDRQGAPMAVGDAAEAALIRQYKFIDAWPRSLAHDDLNSTSSEIILERVVICYRGAPELIFPVVEVVGG